MSNTVLYQQAGNTFFIIDNRDESFDHRDKFSIKSLSKRYNVDGVILLQNSIKANYKMVFFNNDGSRAGMCGNGIASLARYIYDNIQECKNINMETDSGILKLEISTTNVTLKIPLNSIKDLNLDIKIEEDTVHHINTGVPHAIIYKDVSNIKKEGAKIRYNHFFAPEGCNVDFVKINDNGITIRTYERGVEDETKACGTGALASALITHKKFALAMPILVKTESGETLEVNLDDKYITLTGSPKKYVLPQTS